MTRSRKKALLITGILMALPVLFLVEEHFRGKWALAKYKRQLVAKGEKLTIEECRPPVPDAADNGFGEFMRAAAMMDSGSLYDIAPPSLRAVAPGKAQVVYSLPEWPMRTRSRKDSATNSNWRLLEELLAGSRGSIDAAKAALRKSGFEARVSYSLLNLQMAHLAPVKRAAQCLNADALLQLHQGRLEEALNDLESTLRLSHAMGDEPMMISQLVRYAVAGLTVASTWQALQTPGWNDAQLVRLQQAWQTNNFLTPGLRALEMERAMFIDLIGQMRESVNMAANQAGLMDNWASAGGAGAGGAQSFDDLTQNLGEKSGDLLKSGLYIPLWQFAWSYEDERNYVATMQAVLEGARAAMAQQSMRPSSDASKEIERRRDKENFYDRVRHFSSGMVAETFSHYVARAAVAQAQRDLAISAIALKRYELRQGRLPSDLGALVPEYLPEAPRDIFDGQPLRYRLREDGGFLLYSIGKDEKDDGGDPKPPANGGNLYFTNGRDLVWPQAATPKEIEEADEKAKRKK